MIMRELLSTKREILIAVMATVTIDVISFMFSCDCNNLTNVKYSKLVTIYLLNSYVHISIITLHKSKLHVIVS